MKLQGCPVFSHPFFIIASTELKQNWYTGKGVPLGGSWGGNKTFADACLHNTHLRDKWPIHKCFS